MNKSLIPIKSARAWQVRMCVVACLLLLSSSRPSEASSPRPHVVSVAQEPFSMSFSTGVSSIELVCLAPSPIVELSWRTGSGAQGAGVPQYSEARVTITQLQAGDNVVILQCKDAKGQSWTTRFIVTYNPGVSFVHELRSEEPDFRLGTMPAVFVSVVEGQGVDNIDWKRASIYEVNREGRRLQEVERRGPIEFVEVRHGEWQVKAPVTLSSRVVGFHYFRLIASGPQGAKVSSAIAPVRFLAPPASQVGDPRPVYAELKRVFEDALKNGQNRRAALHAALEAARKHPDVTSAEMDFEGDGLTFTLKGGVQCLFSPAMPGVR